MDSQKIVLNFLNTNYPITDKWVDLFTQFIMLDQYNKMPSKTWYQETQILIEAIGEKDFLDIGIKWINDCALKSQENASRVKKMGTLALGESLQNNLGLENNHIPEWVTKVYGDKFSAGGFFRVNANLDNFQNYFYQSLGGRILRGFLHSTVFVNDKKLVDLLDKLAFTNPNHSQDAIHIYSNLPKEVAIPKLTLLKSKATKKSILARINNSIAEVGKKNKMSKSEIEETVIPDFGINQEGEYILELANIKCIYHSRNLKSSELKFELENGKEQKSVPVLIKENYASEFRQFKKFTEEIKQNLSSNKNRIEEFYLIDRKIKFHDFQDKYLNNSLIRILTKDLIWNFQKENVNVNLIYHKGCFVDSNDTENQIDLTDSLVSLWHPIGFQSEYVLNWRNFLLSNQIFQPFKQAFREIYILTDAEVATETYSNRFASHILKKDHVAALCKTRGWSTSGIINDGKITYKIPSSDLKVEYWISDVELGEYSRTYGSAHVSTDQVRFYKKKEQIPLIEVPAMIFSEVMRDVDLFVGVTSIGNDPHWHDRGEANTRNYWSNYSFGGLTESAKVRADILKNIVPKLKIAKHCDFDGRYLKVKGKIRNYKIHIGSGNILMEPNDAYLCIVPDRNISSMKDVFLPFEGDNLLSIIISKAILLADDDKIKDLSIVSQINNK